MSAGGIDIRDRIWITIIIAIDAPYRATIVAIAAIVAARAVVVVAARIVSTARIAYGKTDGTTRARLGNSDQQEGDECGKCQSHGGLSLQTWCPEAHLPVLIINDRQGEKKFPDF